MYFKFILDLLSKTFTKKWSILNNLNLYAMKKNMVLDF